MVLPQLVNTGFQVLFHSPPGVLFTFPSQYSALSVTKEYLGLRGGPRFFPQGFPCLVVLWILPLSFGFRLRGFHPLWQVFPGPFCYPCSWIIQSEPQEQVPGLGSSAFARRYLRNHGCFLFLRLLRCFSSPGSLRTPMYSVHGDRSLSCRVAPFRHLRLLTDICSSPQLFAAYHVFHRLSVPRHPPCALHSLTTMRNAHFGVYPSASSVSYIEPMVHFLITTFSLNLLHSVAGVKICTFSTLFFWISNLQLLIADSFDVF